MRETWVFQQAVGLRIKSLYAGRYAIQEWNVTA